jgi:hypothetical protein
MYEARDFIFILNTIHQGFRSIAAVRNSLAGKYRYGLMLRIFKHTIGGAGSPASEVFSMKSEALPVAGPYFEDLQVGPSSTVAPAITLTDGVAALHGAIVGERLRLALDAGLSRRVAGGVLASPALVWDVAIGQSTLITQRVIANLFYRGSCSCACLLSGIR